MKEIVVNKTLLQRLINSNRCSCVRCFKSFRVGDIILSSRPHTKYGAKAKYYCGECIKWY